MRCIKIVLSVPWNDTESTPSRTRPQPNQGLSRRGAILVYMNMARDTWLGHVGTGCLVSHYRMTEREDGVFWGSHDLGVSSLVVMDHSMKRIGNFVEHQLDY